MRYSLKYPLHSRPAVGAYMNLFIFATELLLAIRVVIQFFVGMSNAGFVEWAYRVSGVLLEPFRWFWVNPTHVESRWQVDFPALMAMVIYPAAAYAILALLAMMPVRAARK